MNAEILCVGTELLLGDTVNTNAAYISRKLSELGINCFYHSAVGDNTERIKKTLQIALERADVVIITGGLGPTDDDITIAAIADYLGKKLVFHEESYIKIQEFFQKRGFEISEKNKKQAFFPENSEIIPNPLGTAPGMICEIDDKIIITLPGVPHEMYKMWENTVSKYLEKYSGYVIVKRFLKFFGIPEGTLGERLKDLMQSENPTVAPLVSLGQANIRIAAKAKSKEESEKLISDMEQEILSRVGQYFWGYDEDTLEQVVGKSLLDKQLTLAIAESCTGGLISSKLTDVSGSSAYIKLNFTTYSNESKTKLLNVKQDLIEKHGVVSEPVAKTMAEGVIKAVGTDIGIGVTGIAGPTGGTLKKPVGLVYIGISDGKNTEINKININSKLPRIEIKQRATQQTLNLLRLFINKRF